MLNAIFTAVDKGAKGTATIKHNSDTSNVKFKWPTQIWIEPDFIELTNGKLSVEVVIETERIP